MKDWLAQLDPKWVVQNVVGWGFLAVVLWAVFAYMIIPAQNQQFKTQDNMVTVQRDIATTLSNQTTILQDIRRNTSK